MNWTVIIVLVLLAGYVVSGLDIEGFTATNRRADIGLSTDGWTEENGYRRDLRYTEAFVDIQGIGTPSDFCRALVRRNKPESLHISCALGRRDGMNTMEYNSHTLGQGFRFSRDDYWRTNPETKRSDYCRILKDVGTGHWFSSCAVAGRESFKRQEEYDTAPPHDIQDMLEAYQGVLAWFRWQDDRYDYAENAAFTVQGTPIFPTLLRPEVSRGLQLNRWPQAAQDAGEPVPPLTDYLRWGEKGTLELNQTIAPRSIRAIACWIWWDGFEKGATIFDSHNLSHGGLKLDRIKLGVEGGGPDLPGRVLTKAVTEVRPEVLQAIGQLTEPTPLVRPGPAGPGHSAAYYFEIWDQEQRIMRLSGPTGSARANEWQHVAVTVTDGVDWWPTWQLWINGELVEEKTDGRLSPAMEITENYIGQNVRGCIQDFRVYSTPLTESKLDKAIAWSKPLLHPLP